MPSAQCSVERKARTAETTLLRRRQSRRVPAAIRRPGHLSTQSAHCWPTSNLLVRLPEGKMRLARRVRGLQRTTCLHWGRRMAPPLRPLERQLSCFLSYQTRLFPLGLLIRATAKRYLLNNPIFRDTNIYNEFPQITTGKRAVVQRDRDRDEYDPRHPEPFSSAGASVLAASYKNPLLMKPHSTHASKPLDFSKTGIVHLPPLPSSGSEHSSPTRPSVSSRQASKLSSDNSVSNSDRSRPALQFPAPQDTSMTGSGTDSDSDSQVRQGSPALMSSGSSSRDELVTHRFQSITNEHGHHVITGREGVLTRCEDEVYPVCLVDPAEIDSIFQPIIAPGAVQGFGVLIVVEEDDETGNLVVRQVSEVSSLPSSCICASHLLL